MNIKKPLVATAALAVVSVAGLGGLTAYATTDNTAADGSSLIQKIATKFNLNVDDVKAVFAEDRAAHEALRAADQAERLTAAVKAGTITQAQADHITAALKEIDNLRGTAAPDTQSSTTRDQIHSKMEELRTWAKDNNIDMRLLGHGGHHHGLGGPETQPDDQASDTNTKS